MAGGAIREATVIGWSGGQLLVRVQPEECGGCGSCALHAVCGGSDRGFDLTLAASAATDYRPGDRVRIRLKTANPAWAAAVLFLPALAGLLLGGWAAVRLGYAAALPFLVACAGGLSAGLGVTWTLSRCVSWLRTEARLLAPEAAGK
ncbi:MAG: SoxR reducing system RseC family protein [Planctomycetes bacterium]|nr:SoxR reducing system RseC family protein [Planctomycetota bacterium]